MVPAWLLIYSNILWILLITTIINLYFRKVTSHSRVIYLTPFCLLKPSWIVLELLQAFSDWIEDCRVPPEGVLCDPKGKHTMAYTDYP